MSVEQRAMDSVPALLERLSAEGIDLWLEEGDVRFRAPPGKLTGERLDALRLRKSEITSFLVSRAAAAADEPALAPQGAAGIHPLTFSQEAFARQYANLKSVRSHHVAFALRVAGTLDFDALRQAVSQLLARHTILRARYAATDDGLRVRIDDSFVIRFETLDLSELGQAQQDGSTRDWLTRLLCERFDLESGPLVRVAVVHCGARDHLVGFITHHSVADAWSIQILAADLTELYRSAVLGTAPRLRAMTVQFTDYAHWLRSWLESAAGRRQLEHWKQVLAGASQPFWLPPDGEPGRASAARPVRAWISAEVTRQLREYAQGEHSTLFTVILAAFASLLARWSRRSDVLISVAHSGRARPEAHPLVGCFIQKWLLRVNLTELGSFHATFLRVARAYREAQPYLQMPYAVLRQELQRASPERFLDITFNYIPPMQGVAPDAVDERAPGASPIVMDNRYWGADDARLEQEAGGARLFAKFVEEGADGLTWSFRFPDGLFAEETVAHASELLGQTLQRAAHDPHASIAEW